MGRPKKDSEVVESADGYAYVTVGGGVLYKIKRDKLPKFLAAGYSEVDNGTNG